METFCEAIKIDGLKQKEAGNNFFKKNNNNNNKATAN